MSVQKLDNNDDWQFGYGLSLYVSRQDEIKQKVKTRLRSFKNDNPFDTEANIDWIYLLSTRNTEDQIENEVRRVVLETEGVLRIDSLSVENDRENRELTIRLTYTDIYASSSSLLFGIV